MFTPPLLAEVGQLPTDPTAERALVVLVVVAATLTTIALATGGSVSVSGSRVAISGGRIGVTAVLASALASVAGLGLTSVVVVVVVVVVSASIGTVVVVVLASSRRSSSAGLGERWCLDGGILDDGVLLVEDLLDRGCGSLALIAPLLLVGGDGGVQVLLVLLDLLLHAVEGLGGGDVRGDVCLGGGAGLLDGEAAAEGTGQGVVSASDCADVAG